MYLLGLDMWPITEHGNAFHGTNAPTRAQITEAFCRLIFEAMSHLTLKAITIRLVIW